MFSALGFNWHWIRLGKINTLNDMTRRSDWRNELSWSEWIIWVKIHAWVLDSSVEYDKLRNNNNNKGTRWFFLENLRLTAACIRRISLALNPKLWMCELANKSVSFDCEYAFQYLPAIFNYLCTLPSKPESWWYLLGLPPFFFVQIFYHFYYQNSNQ